MTSEDRAALLAQARDVLRSNTVRGAGYCYVRPAPRTYEQQWLWDSCFHAIANTHLDPALACAEIETLLAGQVGEGPDAGMIPHMLYHAGGGAALWGHDRRSTITQNPVIAYAVQRIFDATGDVAFLERCYPPLCAYYDWWKRRRDADDDGLVSIIHPWEAWDASPRWDALLGLSDAGPQIDAASRAARFALVPRLAALDYDLAAIDRAGLFNVESCDVNALYLRSLVALAGLARELGRGDDAERYHQRAEQTRTALQERCWDDRLGIYCDLAGGAETPLRIKTAAIFVPLFAGVPRPEQARRLVEHLTSPTEFWTSHPVPTVAVDEPSFQANSYWRGTTWVPVNWLIGLGLARYGEHELAGELARRTVQLVESQGFYEYYNPLTGTGLGASGQSWTALVVDMLEL